MIKIYSEQDSPRLRYILNELFHEMHGFDIELVFDVEEFYAIPDDCPKICYSQEHIGNSLWIEPNELLFETKIEPQRIEIDLWEDTAYFFRTGKDKSDSIPYDVFSAAFYLISRYEEYLPHVEDQHGRFRAEDSLAFKNNFLEEPVIDIWMHKLLDRLYSLFPKMERSKRQYRHLKTIDVDNVFAYRHKGPFINGIHILKDLLNGRTNLATQRLKVIFRLQKDPYFNLEELGNTLSAYSADTIFFFHCGCYGKHDKKVWLPSYAYVQIRKQLAKTFKVGLHPSYRSAHSKWIFNTEKNILEQHTKKTITCCRSHYLLFRLPEDYRMLESLGITDDYTMGYSNNPGFRAGTSLPFHFYDLESERASQLTIHPLAVMDKTLHSNMKLSATEAENYLLGMANKVRKVNGEFVSLFHNENQTDAEGFGWEGWNDMYKDFLKKSN